MGEKSKHPTFGECKIDVGVDGVERTGVATEQAAGGDRVKRVKGRVRALIPACSEAAIHPIGNGAPCGPLKLAMAG